MLDDKHYPLYLTGLSKSSFLHYINLEYEKHKKNIIVLFDSEKDVLNAKEILNCESFIFAEETGKAHSHTNEENVIRILKDIRNTKIYVSNLSSVLAPLPDKIEKLDLYKGQTLSEDSLIEKLEEYDYVREDVCETAMTYSVRGGIVDVFGVGEETPVRLDFFGDEIDDIRIYDAVTQTSIKKIERTSISSARFDDNNGSCFLKYFEDKTIYIYNPKEVLEDNNAENFVNEKLILCSQFPQNVIKYNDIKNINVRTIPNYNGDIERFFEDILEFNKIVIYSRNEKQVESLDKALKERNYENYEILYGDYKENFDYGNIAYFSCSQLFKSRDNLKFKTSSKAKKKIQHYSEIALGDYIAHEVHGIGKFVGLSTQEVAGEKSDYLLVEYAKGDKLYIPINQLKMIYKWQAGEGTDTKLSRLGSTAWENARKRAKKATEDIADELIELYVERMKLIGKSFSADDERMAEFENGFEYEETEDQLTSIEEVKSDMEKLTPMDRLICGDVGYGKTEVAMRASYKAVLDGVQICYLVPTTVLALQHFNTFKKRFAKYGVKIEMLSRLRTATQQKEIINKLLLGEIDIVIGTHSLLSNKIKYKNLGLLIIDEEQRFGVKHKEIIKQLKSSVDVLSLSATPIPRSMHMSLVGIRDYSIIETPPVGRLPVATSVIEYDEEIINKAIERELKRAGQVYYIHNRIASLPYILHKLEKRFPDKNIKIAHGRMSETEIEDIMLSLLNGDIDMLLSTSIIETGIDASNVNTIIIEEASHFGLSSLYQLRGRVGRAGRQAYCLLTYRPDRVLTEDAEKRLKAICEFTEIGSGFKLALKDLEIRGAGNVIGSQQSGHIENIGYDMYQSMLSDAIESRKGEVKEKMPAKLDIGLSAYIPQSYIESEKLRIDTYKLIQDITDIKDAENLENAIEDRYGDTPRAVLNLIYIKALREIATSVGISEIQEKNNNLVITFAEMPAVDKIFDSINKSNGKLKFSAGNTPYLTYLDFNEKDIKNIANLLRGLQE